MTPEPPAPPPVVPIRHERPPEAKEPSKPRQIRPADETYWLTRFVLLRLLGLVYLVAFLVAANQIVPLVGHDGLMPADTFLKRGAAALWLPGLVSGNYRDSFGGMYLTRSSRTWRGWAVVLRHCVVRIMRTPILMLLLWALYMSLHPHVGSFGIPMDGARNCWRRGFPRGVSVSLAGSATVLAPSEPSDHCDLALPLADLPASCWAAGLIKLRPVMTVSAISALYYHYETQPVPNPLSRYLHFAPHWFQKGA